MMLDVMAAVYEALPLAGVELAPCTPDLAFMGQLVAGR